MYKGASANTNNIVTAAEMPSFIEALSAPVREVKIRVWALYSDLTVNQEVTASTIEGTIYVDTSRATRRTCQLRFIDRNGEFTPKDNTSIFYWDKLIKIEYGLKINSTYKYVPLGIFSIDRIEVLVENGAAVLNIDGSDLWKRFSSESFSADASVYGRGWAATTTFNTVIAKCAEFVGIPAGRVLLDPLVGRSSPESTLASPLAYEVGDNIGETLIKWLDSWSIDIYFDVDGNLVTKDKTKAPYNGDLNSAPDFTFTAGDNAIMLGVSKAQSADAIKNHIIVTADNSGKVAIRGEYIEGVYDAVTAPLAASNTSVLKRVYNGSVNTGLTVNVLGYRSIVIRDTTVFTAQQCIDRAKIELAKNLIVEEQVRLPMIVNPLFEGYDAISITETNVGLTNQTYTLDAFDVPMRSSRQELTVKKTRAL
jgi:hypothetical protein